MFNVRSSVLHNCLKTLTPLVDARRKSFQKIRFGATILSLTIWVYLHSFSYCCLALQLIWEITRNSEKIQTYSSKVIQVHQSWFQSKAHMQLPISQ